MKRWITKIEQWPRALTLGAILASALILRLAIVIALPELGDPDNMDTQNYLRIARRLITGYGFAMWLKPTAYVAPVYPFFLAGVFKVFGENLFAVKLIQALLGAATVGLVYALASRFTRPFAALLAALMIAVHPELLGITSFIYTETLFVFLLVAALLILVHAVSSAKWIHFLFGGMMLGLVTLCRGATLQLPIFFLGVLLLSTQRWIWLRRWMIAMAGMVIVMSPWVIRNYHHFNTFLPVATGSGDVFWTGNYLEFDGEFRYEQTQAKLLEIAGEVDLLTRDRILMNDAKNQILAEPLPHAWLFVRKIFRYWFLVYEDVPHGDARQRNWLVFGVLAFTHYALLIFAAVGLVQCRWQEAPAKFLLAFVTYYTLIHAATLAVARYRIPLLPLMSIAAAVGIVWLLEKFFAKEDRVAIGAAAPTPAAVDLMKE